MPGGGEKNGTKATAASITASFVSSPPAVLEALSLAREEMVHIATLDALLLEKHADKFTFYWGEGSSDGWVTESAVDEIVAIAGSGTGNGNGKGKGARLLRCDQGMPHAFCISHGKHMATKCARWLREDLEKY
jgi:hypothetical protein